jgi:hypothetical protein
MAAARRDAPGQRCVRKNQCRAVPSEGSPDQQRPQRVFRKRQISTPDRTPATLNIAVRRTGQQPRGSRDRAAQRPRRTAPNLALRFLCLNRRSDKRPCGARATKSRLEQSARAGRRLGSLAISRLAGRGTADAGDLMLKRVHGLRLA